MFKGQRIMKPEWIKAKEMPEDYMENLHAYSEKISDLLPKETERQLSFSANVIANLMVNWALSAVNPRVFLENTYLVMKHNLETHLKNEEIL